MRIGIVDFLLRSPDTMLFHMARELGFDAVEFSVDRLGDPARLLFDPDRADDIPHLSRATGIVVSSLFATQFLAENLLDPDLGRRRAALLVVRGLAERAKSLDIGPIVIPLLGASEVAGESEEVALAQLAPVLASWSESYGVTFALKTSLHASVAHSYLESAPPERVGFSFDPGFLLAIGRDPLTEWSEMANRVRHIHLTDRALSGIARDLGQGDVPMKPLVEAILSSGYNGTIVLHTPTGAEAKESGRRNRVYLERLLVALNANRNVA